MSQPWALRYVGDNPDKEDGIDFINRVFAGQWYEPMPGVPACGEVLEVPAELTNDATARRLVCDMPAHADDESHRMVDPDEPSSATMWPVDGPDVIVEALARYRAARAESSSGLGG